MRPRSGESAPEVVAPLEEGETGVRNEGRANAEGKLKTGYFWQWVLGLIGIVCCLCDGRRARNERE